MMATSPPNIEIIIINLILIGFSLKNAPLLSCSDLIMKSVSDKASRETTSLAM
jgi:hypothetical protein